MPVSKTTEFRVGRSDASIVACILSRRAAGIGGTGVVHAEATERCGRHRRVGSRRWMNSNTVIKYTDHHTREFLFLFCLNIKPEIKPEKAERATLRGANILKIL